MGPFVHDFNAPSGDDHKGAPAKSNAWWQSIVNDKIRAGACCRVGCELALPCTRMAHLQAWSCTVLTDPSLMDVLSQSMQNVLSRRVFLHRNHASLDLVVAFLWTLLNPWAGPAQASRRTW
ncbi:hypothetical protein AC1031_012657 [Aphanomyces cochlioides]|nr:hypothetical protein AC1031_012657 [Aphanomyces cochlioides]